MAWSPFRDPRFASALRSVGLAETRSTLDADVLISDRWNRLRGLALAMGPFKRFLFWSAEPRFGVFTEPEISVVWGWAKASAMTVYTGDVFYDEAYFIGDCGLDLGVYLDPISASQIPDHDRCRVAFLGAYRTPEESRLILHGRDIDLNQTRIGLALRGRELGVTDIYGSGYPSDVVVGNSGAFAGRPDGLPPGYTGDPNNWQAVKRAILEHYHFNICLENTCFGYYITEKIWQSIQAYCLPIYHGGNRIYEFFPEDSFVDVARFDSFDQVYDFICKMPKEEYLRRLNVCIEVYNRTIRRETENREESLRSRFQKVFERLYSA